MDEQEILKSGMEAYDREDYALAFPYLLKAAEAGDREAQFRCGDLYQYEDKSGEFDEEKAMYWYEKAAKQGHAEAQYRYGLAYDTGWGADEDEVTDVESAFYWYGKAAEQGHAEAQLSCGRMYENGKGTEENLEKALYWFEKAAAQGSADAMFDIGFIYEIEMEPKDLEKALYWYEKAAACGNEEAVFFRNNLSKNLFDSETPEKEVTISQHEEIKIRQKDAEALSQWEDRARQGDAEAAYLCALVYRYERSIKKEKK